MITEIKGCGLPLEAKYEGVRDFGGAYPNWI